MSRLALLKAYYYRLLDALSPRRRELKRLREKWGRLVKPGEKDDWLTSRYFDLDKSHRTGDTADKSHRTGDTADNCASAAQWVDDKTWADLEFPRIFAELDSTETPLGSQILFHRLRSYVDSPRELAEYYANCTALRINASVREEIQLRLTRLQDGANAQLADFVFAAVPRPSKYLSLLPWWSLACLATLVTVYALSLSFWLWFATLGVNIFLIFRLSLPLHREIEMLKSCHSMLAVADELTAIQSDTFLSTALCTTADRSLPEQLLMLRREAPERAKTRKALGWIARSQGPLSASLNVWLNLFFLADLAAYSLTISKLRRMQMQLASTFEILGALDAAIAVASYLQYRTEHCQPLICDGATLEIMDGHHPLIRQPVKNSIQLPGRSALITGSNMAGKTTFIKMLGINIIFGRTMGFCLAAKAVIPNSGVMASIRGEHSVESGKSHYFAELEAIQAFIEMAKCGACKLFLIDELFNGTNTVERLATARAVLEFLAANAQVIVTTHDVELQDDLASSYDLYYFQEDPGVDGFFDFRLRSGKSSQRNAIQLLARKGFPADLVAKAMRYSNDYALSPKIFAD
jgi:MutS domain V